MRWRARAGAILTGAGTVLADDPALTARPDGDQAFLPPLRVVIDPRLRSLPLLRRAARAVPAHWQQRVKTWLQG